MFELHRFLPLFEPAWQADPNKTAQVLGELAAHARKNKLETTATIIEECLLQLAEGHSLAVIGGIVSRDPPQEAFTTQPLVGFARVAAEVAPPPAPAPRRQRR